MESGLLRVARLILGLTGAQIMFVRGMSKQRFGDVKEPYINIDQIVTVEIGHENNVQVKLSDGEEMIVAGDEAKKLLTFLEKSHIG